MILGQPVHPRVRLLLGAEGLAAEDGVPLDPAEPANVARMASEMKLRYIVITSVNRDDLDDGGSHHFAQTVREVRAALPESRIEVLTPDFCGDLDAVARVLDAGPTCSITTWRPSAPISRVRPQANYRQSLDVLQFGKKLPPGCADRNPG